MAATHLLKDCEELVLALCSLQVVNVDLDVLAEALVVDLVEELHDLVLLALLALLKLVFLVWVPDFDYALEAAHLLDS